MTEEELLETVEGVLKPLGSAADAGEEFRDPPLDVLRYYIRPVKMHWLPVLGRAIRVVAVARQPMDIGLPPAITRSSCGGWRWP